MSEEEAIKKCQNIISHKNDKDIAYGAKFIHHYMMSVEEHEAIETLLDLYQQEKEKNKELINGQIDFWLGDKEIEERIKTNYISKDKIKAKIEELEKVRECFTNSTGMTEISTSIDTLQDLLEEE